MRPYTDTVTYIYNMSALLGIYKHGDYYAWLWVEELHATQFFKKEENVVLRLANTIGKTGTQQDTHMPTVAYRLEKKNRNKR